MKIEDQKIKQINILSFVVLFELVFLLIIYKVFNVPITHDETSTAVHYNNFSVWQIMMYPDPWPNNHILNTLLTKLMISVFGIEQWVVRLPNLLSFLVYAFAICRINKTILKTTSVFFIPAALLFICNPYLLDFFGLSRGYAMSCALCTLSLSYMISGFRDSQKKHIWLALVLSILASYANFTLMVFWVATTIFSWLFFLNQYKKVRTKLIRPTLSIVLFSLVFIALVTVPIIKMQSTDQFKFWDSKGFYSSTMVPLVIKSLYTQSSVLPLIYHSLSIFTIVIVFGNLVYIGLKFFRGKSNYETITQPVVISTGLLLLTSIVSILQSLILKTPNLQERTALFFYPLFITVLVSTIGLLPEQKNKIAGITISVFISFLLLFQIADKTDLKSVREWHFDNGTTEILDYLNKINPGETVTLKTSWLFYPSFEFYRYAGKTPLLNLIKGTNPITIIKEEADYFYITKDDMNAFNADYEIAYKVDDERFLLRPRKTTLSMAGRKTEYVKLNQGPNALDSGNQSEQDSTVISWFLFTKEFSPEFCKRFADITKDKWIFIFADIKVSPFEETDPAKLKIVITRENNGKILNYFASGENKMSKLKQDQWTTLKSSAILPIGDKNDLIKAYLWNPEKRKIKVADFVVHYSGK